MIVLFSTHLMLYKTRSPSGKPSGVKYVLLSKKRQPAWRKNTTSFVTFSKISFDLSGA